MKKRWNQNGFLSAIKRGLTSLFVCAFVLSPFVLLVVHYSSVFGGPSLTGDPRKVADVQPLAGRGLDRTSAPLRPFQEPIITVTFDDGWESIYSNGLPLLQQHGIPTTQYIMSGRFDDTSYMTLDQVKSLQKAGHEIACHTIDHADLTTLSASAVDKQLRDCRDLFERALGTPVRHFASPYGSSNPTTISAIKSVYGSHRNTAGDIINSRTEDQDINVAGNFNAYNITAITIRRDTTMAQLQDAIGYTIRTNGWLVLNYHDVRDGDSEYGVTPATLDAQLRAISQSKVRVGTVGDVLNAYQKQTGR